MVCILAQTLHSTDNGVTWLKLRVRYPDAAPGCLPGTCTPDELANMSPEPRPGPRQPMSARAASPLHPAALSPRAASSPSDAAPAAGAARGAARRSAPGASPRRGPPASGGGPFSALRRGSGTASAGGGGAAPADAPRGGAFSALRRSPDSGGGLAARLIKAVRPGGRFRRRTPPEDIPRAEQRCATCPFSCCVFLGMLCCVV